MMPARLISTVLLSATGPTVATNGPSITGLLFQVIFSFQLVLLMRLNTPPVVESLVTNRRSLAACTTAPAGKPLTVKQIKACLALELLPTTEKLLPPLILDGFVWLT